MYRIKRTKVAPVGPDGITTTAVHYAVSVAPEGNVTAWTTDRQQAGLFADDVFARVEAHYRDRPHAGEVKHDRPKATKPSAEPK